MIEPEPLRHPSCATTKPPSRRSRGAVHASRIRVPSFRFGGQARRHAYCVLPPLRVVHGRHDERDLVRLVVPVARARGGRVVLDMRRMQDGARSQEAGHTSGREQRAALIHQGKAKRSSLRAAYYERSRCHVVAAERTMDDPRRNCGEDVVDAFVRRLYRSGL